MPPPTITQGAIFMHTSMDEATSLLHALWSIKLSLKYTFVVQHAALCQTKQLIQAYLLFGGCPLTVAGILGLHEETPKEAKERAHRLSQSWGNAAAKIASYNNQPAKKADVLRTVSEIYHLLYTHLAMIPAERKAQAV